MVFSRVRAIGTIVCQENADIGANCRFIYIDDGTGVVAFTLNKNCKSEEQTITEDLEQRLLMASQAHQTLNGITVEVMGKLCHRETVCTPSNSNTDASKLPRVWIECSQLTVKDDAMAETAATFDTIATYQFLFPKGFGKTASAQVLLV
ncbi:hypothetical protein GGH96_006214 [Coemansia sp. RSA 1972]|nr:hypothetical protein GGH96_006214 [Coemansia sp. RSA 1972]